MWNGSELSWLVNFFSKISTFTKFYNVFFKHFLFNFFKNFFWQNFQKTHLLNYYQVEWLSCMGKHMSFFCFLLYVGMLFPIRLTKGIGKYHLWLYGITRENIDIYHSWNFASLISLVIKVNIFHSWYHIPLVILSNTFCQPYGEYTTNYSIYRSIGNPNYYRFIFVYFQRSPNVVSQYFSLTIWPWLQWIFLLNFHQDHQSLAKKAMKRF